MASATPKDGRQPISLFEWHVLLGVCHSTIVRKFVLLSYPVQPTEGIAEFFGGGTSGCW
jgi:hypothetical protein